MNCKTKKKNKIPIDVTLFGRVIDGNVNIDGLVSYQHTVTPIMTHDYCICDIRLILPYKIPKLTVKIDILLYSSNL